MENNYFDKLTNELMDKGKWSEFLRRFIEVLRINIFIIDASGKLVIPPLRNGNGGVYGGDFLTSSFGFDLSGNDPNLIEEFGKQGPYLEAKDPFDFRCFAIPIQAEKQTVAYMFVGPVVLNKRWDESDYVNLASKLGISQDGLMDDIQDIRVVSFITMKSILDLLTEVVKDVVEISLEKKKFEPPLDEEVFSKEIAEVAQDMYARIHLDELLVTILDVALSLTHAECGSIMILDDDKKHLSIKVSRGIKQDQLRNSRLKVGEGIAGLAAQDNRAFFINGTKGESRIKHLLKRPDIKQSVVLPLSSKDRVLGVINLHTKSEENKIKANVSNIRHLSKLITTAINSI